MTITPHLLLGSAVAASTTNNVFAAFLIGFILHFVLDAIPHLDQGTFHNVRLPGYKKKITLETVHAEDKPWPLWIYLFAISEFIVVWLFVILAFYQRSDFPVIVFGGLGSITVDTMDNPVFQSVLGWPILKQIHWLHHRVHHDLDPKKWYWGLLIEFIIIGGSIWLLLKF